MRNSLCVCASILVFGCGGGSPELAPASVMRADAVSALDTAETFLGEVYARNKSFPEDIDFPQVNHFHLFGYGPSGSHVSVYILARTTEENAPQVFYATYGLGSADGKMTWSRCIAKTLDDKIACGRKFNMPD